MSRHELRGNEYESQVLRVVAAVGYIIVQLRLLIIIQ
jgi:hypothetical protein